MDYSFDKTEKLTHKAAFDRLYTDGQGIKSFPFTLKFIESSVPEGVDRQVAVVVPKRRLKRAVDRNRTKRQMRELYRLHKHKIWETGRGEAWSIMYLGNRVNQYAFLEQGFLKLIEKYNEQRKSESEIE